MPELASVLSGARQHVPPRSALCRAASSLAAPRPRPGSARRACACWRPPRRRTRSKRVPCGWPSAPSDGPPPPIAHGAQTLRREPVLEKPSRCQKKGGRAIFLSPSSRLVILSFLYNRSSLAPEITGAPRCLHGVSSCVAELALFLLSGLYIYSIHMDVDSAEWRALVVP